VAYQKIRKRISALTVRYRLIASLLGIVYQPERSACHYGTAWVFNNAGDATSGRRMYNDATKKSRKKDGKNRKRHFCCWNDKNRLCMQHLRLEEWWHEAQKLRRDEQSSPFPRGLGSQINPR
jgi:hypothetical protein